jgi:hypothetical protein
MTPSSMTLSDGIHGGIGSYNAALFAAIVIVLVIGAIVWFRRR